LVDSKRDHDQLLAMCPGPGEEILSFLLAQGFIEATGRSGTPAAPPASKPAATASGAATVPVPPRAMPEQLIDAALTARRLAAVRELNEILGPTGESIAIKMERARDVVELRQLVRVAVQVIANARGNAVADGYAQRHG